MRLALALALAALLAERAAADVIHYKDGRTIEGRIIERTATELVVETDFGKVRVALAKVERIEAKSTAAEELAQKRARVAANDAASLFDLAVWARDHELKKEEQELLLAVLAADPGHEMANEMLGRKELDGRWFSPEELDAYVRSMEAERRAQGLMFDNGAWRPEKEVMEGRGFRLYKDQWLPRREAETKAAVEDLGTLVGIKVTPTSGEFVTLYSSLPEDETAAIVGPMDLLVKDLLERLQPLPPEREGMLRYDVPVFLLPDEGAVARFMESGFVVRFSPTAGFEEKFHDAGGFSLYWPRPLIGLRLTRPDSTERDELQRVGILTHQLAHVMVQRFKQLYPCPPWVEAGFAAYYEGLITGYGSTTITAFGRTRQGEAVDPFTPGWGDYNEWQKRLTDPAELEKLPAIDTLMSAPIDQLDSRDVGIAWSLIRYLIKEHPTELSAYLRAYGSRAEDRAGSRRQMHEAAWAASFQQPLETVLASWREWLLAQPRFLAPERLSR